MYECCLSNKETSEETPPKEYLKNKIRELEQKYEEEKTQLKDKLAEGTLEQKQIFEEKLKLMREKEEIENRLLQVCNNCTFLKFHTYRCIFILQFKYT